MRLKVSGPIGSCYLPPALTKTHSWLEEPVMATADSTPTYRDVQGFPGYRVGDDGSVWSCKNARWGLRSTWKRMKLYPVPSGHLSATLMGPNRKARHIFAHILVLNAFVGPCPDGLECCHEDGDPTNNHVGNLRWDTRKANVADTRRHGKMLIGEAAPGAYLTEDVVRQIRSSYVRGEVGYKTLAKRFRIPFSTVVGVINRRTWKHI